jgi:hypothetical protein
MTSWHLAAVEVSVHVERLMDLFLAGPEGGAAPPLMLEYQKSRRCRTALGLAFDVGFRRAAGQH